VRGKVFEVPDEVERGVSIRYTFETPALPGLSTDLTCTVDVLFAFLPENIIILNHITQKI